MADSFTLVGGAIVNCTDGPCGTLGRLIIDPPTKTITHLAVEPMGLLGAGRLVPVQLVDGAGATVSLSCSKVEFAALEADDASQIMPTYAMRGSALPFSYMTLHQIPEGEVEVNGEENIEASDGRFGHLRGIEIDTGDHHITRLLLTVGHFRAKRSVAVPGDFITAIDNEAIKLSATKAQLTGLPEA